MSARLSAGSPLRLLRRHVRRGAQDHPDAGVIAGVVIVGDCDDVRRDCARASSIAFARPKSSTFTVPSLAHLDVRGLQIAMDDPLLVRRFERFGDLLRDRQRLVERDRAARDALRQVVALRRAPSRARDAVSFFEAVDARDVRVIQRGQHLRFALEPRQALGSAANASGRTLIATSRLSFVSRARYTSPIPPAPSGETIS